MLLDQFSKLIEKILAIVRASRRFGMILNTKSGVLVVLKTGDCIVVKIDVGYRKTFRKRFPVNCKAMILASDFDFTRSRIEDRLVGAPVTELHFERLGTASQRKQLMAKADPKHRSFAEQL